MPDDSGLKHKKLVIILTVKGKGLMVLAASPANSLLCHLNAFNVPEGCIKMMHWLEKIQIHADFSIA